MKQEADPKGISHLLCSRFLSLVVQLCLLFDPLGKEEAAGPDKKNFIGDCERYFCRHDGSYIPMFHDKTALVHKMFKTKDAWERMGAKYAKYLLSQDNTSPKGHKASLAACIRRVEKGLQSKYVNSGVLLFGEIGVEAVEKAAFISTLQMMVPFSSSNIACLKQIAGLSIKLMHKVCL